MSAFEDKTLVEIRRDLHRHPELGWLEYRSTALVAEELEQLGYSLSLGSSATVPESRLGLPSADEQRSARERAREEGAPQRYLKQLDDGTGLVAERTFGDGDGPTIGIRVDLDALPRTETSNQSHRPVEEGFASIHPGHMHACGHDGHTAIGIGIARNLVEGDEFNGEVRLFFQPAEEGGRGAKAMSETGLLDDIDYFLALHLGFGNPTGRIVAGYHSPLANAKYDITLDGTPSHAGSAPQEGHNTLQAMAVAIQNLYGIPRHSEGSTRVNVGMVDSGNPQNVISEKSTMRVEVRGRNEDLNEYMMDAAERICGAAAEMHDVDVVTELFGRTTTFDADEELIQEVCTASEKLPGVDDVVGRKQFEASEDASFLIRRVQQSGGKGTFVGIGSATPSGHHTAEFDIDECAIEIGSDVVSNTIRRLGG